MFTARSPSLWSTFLPAIFAACLLMLWACVQITPAASAGEVYFNGQIITMNATQAIVESMFVDRGRIVDTGTTADMRRYLSMDHRGVDLQGRTVIPGIIDAHGHFPASGLSEVAVNLNSPPMGTVTTVSDALQLLRQKASTHPAGQWIYAYGYDDSLIQDKRLLTLAELNSISTRHPIFVQHTSGHQGMTNTRGLLTMGYNDLTPDPSGGHFGHDTTGQLNGLLLETASDPVKRAALDGPLLDRLKIIGFANHDYLAHGVTTAQSGATPQVLVKVLSWLSKLQLIPLRLVVYPMEDNGRGWVEGRYDYAQDSHEKFHIGAVKLFVDGSIQAYSGLLKAPYFEPQTPEDPNHRGHERVDLKTLKAQVLFFHKAGKQLAIHANGDQAIENVIAAVAYAQQVYYRSDPRHILIHAQMLSPAQMERMHHLGLTPSFFNSHVYYWGDRHRDRFLGPTRAARLNPLNDAAQSGHRFTLHTDTPVVPMDPMMMIWSATERLTRSGKVLGAHQRIDRLRALQAITRDAAWQAFLEQELGSLEKGKRADFVVLSGSLLTAKDVRNIKVLKTFIDGKAVYTHPSF